VNTSLDDVLIGPYGSSITTVYFFSSQVLQIVWRFACWHLGSGTAL